MFISGDKFSVILQHSPSNVYANEAGYHHQGDDISRNKGLLLWHSHFQLINYDRIAKKLILLLFNIVCVIDMYVIDVIQNMLKNTTIPLTGWCCYFNIDNDVLAAKVNENNNNKNKFLFKKETIKSVLKEYDFYLNPNH